MCGVASEVYNDRCSVSGGESVGAQLIGVHEPGGALVEKLVVREAMETT